MAITVVGSTSGTTGGGPSSTADNMSISMPAGSQSGDLIVALGCVTTQTNVGPVFFVAGVGNTTFSVVNRSFSASQLQAAILYWVRGATAPTSVAISCGGAQFGGVGGLIVLRGFDSSNPMKDTDSNGNSSSSAPSLPSLDVGNEGGIAIVLACSKTSGGFTPPSGFTERWDLNKGTQMYATCVTKEDIASPNTGAITWGNNHNPWATVGAIFRAPVIVGPVLTQRHLGA